MTQPLTLDEIYRFVIAQIGGPQATDVTLGNLLLAFGNAIEANQGGGGGGSQGPQGFQGNQGFQGAGGAQGNQGTQGFQGNQGFQGSTGAQGAQGAQGSGSIITGEGSPEGVVTHAVGGAYQDTTNGALYFKLTGTGNTGWAAGNGASPGINTGADVGAGFSPDQTVYQISIPGDTSSGSIVISDALAEAGTANGIFYITDGADGDQVVRIQLGSTGQFTTLFNKDGSVGFPAYIQIQALASLFSFAGNPNSNVTALAEGDTCFDTATPGIWQASAAGSASWSLATGTQGHQGNQGAQGAQGPSGGAQGAQGAQGFQGATGAQGAQGNQGTQGATGAQGTQGHQGFQGTQGFQGPQGQVGAQGTQGVQGFQGFQGTTGTGTQGPQGFQGPSGGAQGPQGFQGAMGTTGNQGVQGSQGHQGTQGTQGAQGAAGTNGSQGNQGTQGFQGIPGDVVPTNSQSANYVPVLSDLGKCIEMNSSSATTITLNTSVFSAGDTFEVCQVGTGTVTFVQGSGFTLTSYLGDLVLAGQWATATVRYRSGTAAVVAGALT